MDFSKEEIKEFEKATREASIVPTILAAKDCYNNATTAIRDLVNILNCNAAQLRVVMESLAGGASVVRDMIGGTLTFASDDFHASDDAIVDDAKFVELCQKTANHPDHLKGMARAAKICEKITNLIEARRATAAKFIMTDGRSENEIKVMRFKAYQVEKTIEILQARGETMTNIFYAHKRYVEKFVAQAIKDFKPIFKK